MLLILFEIRKCFFLIIVIFIFFAEIGERISEKNVGKVYAL